MKKKGFTLIELLAVIVILAIIALISTPIIISVLERARKGAFEDSAYGIIDAAKLYYADASLDGGINSETFTFPENAKLKITGEKPKSGTVTLDEEGKVEIAISNGTWCATKRKDEEKVTITDYSVGNCKIDIEKEEPIATSEDCFTVNPDDLSEITGYTCRDTITDVVIPKKINNVDIKKIGDEAFFCSSYEITPLTSVYIPEGVIEIGSMSFLGNAIEKVTIPESVTIIKDHAFYSNMIPSVTIPNGVVSIGVEAFWGNQLESVNLKNGLINIGQSAFSYNHLSSVIIPDSVNIIDGAAFLQNQLENIRIGNSVVTIGDSAFAHNQLTSVIIPKSVISIDGAAFNDNRFPTESAFIYARNNDGTENKSIVVSYAGVQRDNVIIPEGVISIGAYSFNSINLISVTIPNSIKYIEKRAFWQNDLTNVMIPNGVLSIGEEAFSDNSELSNVDIASSVESIGKNAFFGTTSITIHKAANSISGSPWGAHGKIEWTG